MSLEFCGLQWLKFEKRCPLVIFERAPRPLLGSPDILGVTDAGYLLEIEVKRSVSDFRANAHKYHIQIRSSDNAELRNRAWKMAPKQTWFLVPNKITDKVLPEVPEWAGLLSFDDNHDTWAGITCVKKSPVNNLSERLSLLACGKLLRNVGNQIYSLLEGRRTMIRSGWECDIHAFDNYYSQKLEFTGQRHEWVPNPDYLNFQI